MIDKEVIGKQPKYIRNIAIIKKIIDTIITIIFIPIAIISIILLVQTFQGGNEGPNVFGYKFFIITSGSMEPTIKVSDFIIIKEIKPEDVKIEDVITYKENSIFVTHRVIDIYKENGRFHYVTKGDNNNVQDDRNVIGSDIEGKFITRVPMLGNIISFIQRPIGLVILIAIPIIFTLINQKIENYIDEKRSIRETKRLKYIEKQK